MSIALAFAPSICSMAAVFLAIKGKQGWGFFLLAACIMVFLMSNGSTFG